MIYTENTKAEMNNSGMCMTSCLNEVLNCVKNVAPSFQDTFTPRSIHHHAMLATIMNEIVCIKQQVEVLCCLCQEERLHTIFFPMIPNIFYLQKYCIRINTESYKATAAE